MDAITFMREQAVLSHQEMQTAIDGVTPELAWSVLANDGADYLHSDASIHGIVLHVASAKIIYGSLAFQESAIRWRDVAAEIEQFEPDWPKAIAYFEKAQAYWMDSWSGLGDEDLERDVNHFSGKRWPAWKVIRMVTHHDSYHAGQIAMLRYACREATTTPPSVAEDIRKYCAELPSW